MIQPDFLNPVCKPKKLDNFFIRQSILSALKNNLGHFQGTLLDVGCGQMPYKTLVQSSPGHVTQYISLDFEKNPIHDNAPDITWQNGNIPLENNSIDCVLCTEVFEHCPDPEVVMREIYRVLKPNGLLFFTVPFLWPLHEVPYDHYRYTPFALQKHLSHCSFSQIEINAMGGWDASLAQMLGLWVRRRPMGRQKRKVLSYLFWPIVWLLTKLDSRSDVLFTEGVMITGLTGTARK